jgi:hypothetical protein
VPLLPLHVSAVVSAMGTTNWLTIIINNMLSGTALINSTSSGAAPAAAAKAAAAAKHANTQSTRAILLSGIPAFCASIAMMLTAWHADRVNEKNWHVAVPYLIGGVALTLFTPMYKASFIAGFVTLVVALTFANAATGVINARVVGELTLRMAARLIQHMHAAIPSSRVSACAAYVGSTAQASTNMYSTPIACLLLALMLWLEWVI